MMTKGLISHLSELDELVVLQGEFRNDALVKCECKSH
jgi:hypothetical protein